MGVRQIPSAFSRMMVFSYGNQEINSPAAPRQPEIRGRRNSLRMSSFGLDENVSFEAVLSWQQWLSASRTLPARPGGLFAFAVCEFKRAG